MAPLTKQIKYQQRLQSATIRDFSGGWNVLDDDLNLASKYSTKLYNMYADASKCIRVRAGTARFIDLSSVSGIGALRIINLEYFNGSLIAVMSDGKIVRITAANTGTVIWNDTIAALLPDAPDGWNTTVFASFAQFNGSLIICNGSDKPLIIDEDFVVDYLHDPATGSNLNTPIARYVIASDRFLLMTGDPVYPDRIHCSARDAPGVWYGDPDPNDATYIDIGGVLPNATVIRGIVSFRQNVIVFYAEGSVIGSIGTYDADGNHVLTFDDPIVNYGSLAHRSIVPYGDDVLMVDRAGIPSLKRTVFTGTLRPERVSDLVDPDMVQHLALIPGVRTQDDLENNLFGVYNKRDGQFFFFMPYTNTESPSPCYVFTYRPNLSVANWSRFDGWNFVCGCSDLDGLMYFGDRNGKVWIYANTSSVVYDFYGDASIGGGGGIPIAFTWELPWVDFDRRTRTKQSKYLSFDTVPSGSSNTCPFTVEMFVDRFSTALLTTVFAGATAAPVNNTFRNANHQLLYSWPAKFELAKLKITGSTFQTTQTIKFVSISMQYLRGSNLR